MQADLYRPASSVLELRGGEGLRLTTARYYTPSGRSIQGKGITPDIMTMMAVWIPMIVLYEIGVIAVLLIVHPYLKRKYLPQS